ncbi:hypothetical protein K435DRAFT_801536 [Dendrothele bispora CBS 962.96]|uniref:DUF6534 domain-containing protein n=1 Tax=Dendrothele bispora (strain CBS 962.96) TaxID=1314807 RepID=A0A4S8LNW3_DENBC|nr:hypothetical protein K435DRAFT_801536 [Dendrothele bispora CBS 962.96]
MGYTVFANVYKRSMAPQVPRNRKAKDIEIAFTEYQTLIAHFGDTGPLFVINPELISSILFTVLVSVPTQIFFVYRIYILSQKKIILPAFLVLCIIGETVIAILYVGFSLSPKTTIQDLLTANNLVGRLGPTMMIIAAFIDVVIATSMVYFLRKTKVEALSNTQRIVLRLIIYSVNTGLWTAFLAIAVAVTTFTNGETFIPIGLYIPISALYCNTLLANLNIRQHVRKGLQDVITLSIMTPHTASSAAQDQDHFAVRVARSTSTFTYGNNTEDSHRKKLQTDV